MEENYEQLLKLLTEIKLFFSELKKYLVKNLNISFLKFEYGKSTFAAALYKQRGKLARRFMHSGMAGITALGMIIAPIIAEEFPGRSVDPWKLPSSQVVLSATTEDPNIMTTISEKTRDKIIEYTVVQGDTVSSIAEKFGVSEDTIRWQNNLKSKASIKVGQVLEILPVTGIYHKVAKGETVYSIAKKYDASPQAIVDFPYNTFTDDETFALAVGQMVVVPDGVKPDEVLWSPVARVRQITPDAGTVVASGNFVWPVGGTISQRFSWYHPGIDIANSSAPNILAADAGTVEIAGWPDNYGFGNRVLVNHGNGYKTQYAHLSQIYVIAGQTVARGAALGRMGSTGRSTGIHLDFRIFYNGGTLNPLNVLK